MSATPATIDDFANLFFDSDPMEDGANLIGVQCAGTCGAPCWEPAPQAQAAGITPTLDDILTSASHLMSGVGNVLHDHDAEENGAFAPAEVRRLHAVQGTVAGVDMLVLHASRGDEAVDVDHLDDYVSPLRGLVGGVVFYLEDGLPAETAAAVGPEARDALARVRALMAQVAGELDTLAGLTQPVDYSRLTDR